MTASERIRAAREAIDYHAESRISNVNYKLELALKEWLEVRLEYGPSGNLRRRICTKAAGSSFVRTR